MRHVLHVAGEGDVEGVVVADGDLVDVGVAAGHGRADAQLVGHHKREQHRRQAHAAAWVVWPRPDLLLAAQADEHLAQRHLHLVRRVHGAVGVDAERDHVPVGARTGAVDGRLIDHLPPRTDRVVVCVRYRVVLIGAVERGRGHAAGRGHGDEPHARKITRGAALHHEPDRDRRSVLRRQHKPLPPVRPSQLVLHGLRVIERAHGGRWAADGARPVGTRGQVADQQQRQQQQRERRSARDGRRPRHAFFPFSFPSAQRFAGFSWSATPLSRAWSRRLSTFASTRRDCVRSHWVHSVRARTKPLHARSMTETAPTTMLRLTL